MRWTVAFFDRDCGAGDGRQRCRLRAGDAMLEMVGGLVRCAYHVPEGVVPNEREIELERFRWERERPRVDDVPAPAAAPSDFLQQLRADVQSRRRDGVAPASAPPVFRRRQLVPFHALPQSLFDLDPKSIAAGDRDD